MISDRENWLRAIGFGGPEWIPCSVILLPIAWHAHRERLEELVLRHPSIFPRYERGSVSFDEFPEFERPGTVTFDNWGCGWRVEIGGAEGQVVVHPLADWSALDTWRPPDPLTKAERADRDWAQVKVDLAEQRRTGQVAMGWGERLFDRLYALRGFENLMIDIATDEPRLQELIGILTEHELKLADLWLDADVDAIAFHTDIGTQRALMISPAKFRKHIKPMYAKIFQRVRQAGRHVALSTDGHVLEIVDDLIECGVSMHDPQIRANTLEGIERHYKGRMCINLDLDRQMFMFCTPDDIRSQIREAVRRLSSPRGGLMMFAAICDGATPLENIEAICTAMEDYCINRMAT